jgi:gluconate 5-dehydrogenase
MSPFDSFRLDGRTALVCGAARGLGWEIARSLGQAGAHVVLNGRSAERLAPRVEELTAAGVSAEASVFDLADRQRMQEAVVGITARRQAIDILVNAVGERDRRAVHDIAAEDFDRLVDTNLGAAYALVKQVVPGMLARRWGRIVMVTSIVDQLAVPRSASYVAAKGGLAALVRALASELGIHGVTCNALSPGFFATEFNRHYAQGAIGAEMAARVPLGRWGEPREIAGAALFLCSPAASYVNGHTLVVDGGVSATYAMFAERKT